MSCCERDYSNFFIDKFIVDGIHFNDAPANWTPINEFGPRLEIVPTLSGKTSYTAQYRLNNGTTLLPENAKKTVLQAWAGTWQTPNPMSLCLRDKLFMLYTLQKTFYLQYDDEMSRVWGLCYCADNERKIYYTPTYPVYPVGLTADNPSVEFTTNVKVEGDVPVGLTYNIDRELGVVYFNKPLTNKNKVFVTYVWRSKVRILALSVEPVDNLKTYYHGDVVFGQVKYDVNVIESNWTTTYSCSQTFDTGSSDYTHNTETGSLISAPSEGITDDASVSSEFSELTIMSNEEQDTLATEF